MITTSRFISPLAIDMLKHTIIYGAGLSNGIKEGFFLKDRKHFYSIFENIGKRRIYIPQMHPKNNLIIQHSLKRIVGSEKLTPNTKAHRFTN